MTRLRWLLAGLVAMGCMVAPAHARWSSPAAGTATAMSATLAAPANLIATCGGVLGLASRTVRLTWDASPTPWKDGYEVLSGAAAGSYTPIATTTALTYDATGLSVGTHHFTVRATKANWRSLGAADVHKKISLLVVYSCGN